MKHTASIIVLFQGVALTLADVDFIVKIISGLIVATYYSRKWYLMEKKK